jgi:tetratricopeptide (TPR) repeat protein
MNGDHARAAQLLASLSEAQPGQAEIAKKALSEALGAGRIELALRLARSVSAATLPTDARLLLVGEEIKRGHSERALAFLDTASESGDLTFFDPLFRAWSAADHGDAAQALSALDQIPPRSLLSPLADEEHALILLKFGRTAEAEPYARRAVGSAGGRERRLRLGLADGFLAAGDRQRALMIIEGMGAGETAARQRITGGKTAGQAIDSLPKAFAEVLTAFSIDLARMARTAPPIGLVQVARYVNPQDSSITDVLALLIAGQNRTDEALALLTAVRPDDPQVSQNPDVETRILIGAKRMNDAYRVAATAAAAAGADWIDYSRLGDVFQAMNRHSEAGDAYGRAVALARAENLKGELSNLLLLQAGALEEAKRWPEAKVALQQALAIAPEQPALLNFLGYAELERGENVDSAEAMIRKANELAPDDASITDSLGWAEFKRGKVDQAIATLQQAAEKDPQQAEIQEHLGDALYRSGRRYEARFAWSAALATAEDETVARLKGKLASGLTSANAAP